MPDPGTPSGPRALPRELFDASTFGSLGGAALVTWVVTNVITGVFQTEVKVTGLVVAIAVAFAGLYLTKQKRSAARHVVAFFNGFLIYATVTGATAFTPYLNEGTAQAAEEDRASLTGTFTRPWVQDRNLVEATRTLQEISQEQSLTLREVGTRLEAVKNTIEKEGPLAPHERMTLRREVIQSADRIQTFEGENQDRVSRLQKLGLKRNP
jgi:hypothetical protein